jgi:hypothetical protein
MKVEHAVVALVIEGRRSHLTKVSIQRGGKMHNRILERGGALVTRGDERRQLLGGVIAH